MMCICQTEVIAMPKQVQIQAFMKDAGDIVTSKKITAAGFHRSILSELVKENELIQIRRGVYLKPTAWEDDMYLLQYRFSKGVYSHETALYLHVLRSSLDLTDRTPMKYTMTFPWGYNVTSLKGENLMVKRSVKKLHELGIMELPSPAGNNLRVYDVERTLCDIVRGNNVCELSITNQAMKSYAFSKGKDIHKLMEYAEKLRVKSKILNYMRVLL
jgi:predicted transcriptional regulator of viral defense system